MSNWKSATEMYALTQQKVKEYKDSVESRIPQYMDKAMSRIHATALHCQFGCTVEFKPEIADDNEIIGDIVIAVKAHLQKLGYNVKSATRVSLQIEWRR